MQVKDFLTEPDPTLPAGCYDEEFTETLIIDDLPGYTGCTFTVEFHFLICESGGATQVEMGDFQIIDHDCQKFSDEISDPNMTISEWSDYIADFDQEIKDIITQHMINKYFDPEKFSCDLGILLNVEVFSTACYEYYVVPISWLETIGGGDNLDGSTAEHRTTMNGPIKVSCGTECCKRTYEVCADENGDMVVNITITQPTTHCGEDPLIDVPVAITEKMVLFIPCNFDCNF